MYLCMYHPSVHWAGLAPHHPACGADEPLPPAPLLPGQLPRHPRAVLHPRHEGRPAVSASQIVPCHGYPLLTPLPVCLPPLTHPHSPSLPPLQFTGCLNPPYLGLLYIRTRAWWIHSSNEDRGLGWVHSICAALPSVFRSLSTLHRLTQWATHRPRMPFDLPPPFAHADGDEFE